MTLFYSVKSYSIWEPGHTIISFFICIVEHKISNFSESYLFVALLILGLKQQLRSRNRKYAKCIEKLFVSSVKLIYNTRYGTYKITVFKHIQLLHILQLFVCSFRSRKNNSPSIFSWSLSYITIAPYFHACLRYVVAQILSEKLIHNTFPHLNYD